MHSWLSRLQRRHWIGLILAALAGAILAFFLLRDSAVGHWVRGFSFDALIARIQAFGPWVFFGAMALLPVVGFPVLPFYLVAGKTFGVPVALVGCLSAIALNVLLSFVVARSVMHPAVEWVVRKMGREVPQVPVAHRWMFAWLLRITPGPPFFVQSYLLALGGVPFKIYMVVSVAVQWAYGAAFILFGESVLSGNKSRVLGSIAVLVAVIVIIRLIRRRLQARAAAVLPDEAVSAARTGPSRQP